MLRKLWLLSAPPDVSSVVSEEVSEVLVVVGGALSVGSGGVCRLADSRLACFARCYQVAAFCMACNVLYHCKHLILLFGFSPYLGKYNIFVCATLISQVRLNQVYFRKQRIKVAHRK